MPDLVVSSIAVYVSSMEKRQRGNPPGNTNGHVAVNLRRARQSTGVDLRTLSARLKAAGRSISPSALSKIENGDRRVDVDDLAALAYALETTPADLFTPVDDAPAPTGVPEEYVPEEVQSWVQGKVKLTSTDLIRYWTDQAWDCQSYIKRFTDLLALMGDEEKGITPRAVYEERLAAQRKRLAFIRGRLLQLDPNGVPIQE